MKRNWDLVRKILLHLESQPEAEGYVTTDAINGFSEEVVANHYKLMAQSGLITIIDTSSLSGPDYAAKSLTWDGHEFLDQIRQDTVWNKVKSNIKEKGLDLSIEVIKLSVSQVLKSMFE